MNPRAREIEFLALTMFAALPLYATQAISPVVVAVFHLLMGAVLVRVARGGGPEIVPPAVLSVFAVCYFIFFFIDAFALSRNLIKTQFKIFAWSRLDWYDCCHSGIPFSGHFDRLVSYTKRLCRYVP